MNTKAYKTPERLGKQIWIFHETDSDLNPSVLHGNSIEKDYRLDALNGAIYKGNDLKNPKGYLNAYELSTLHSNSKFQKFTIKRINWVNGNCSRANFQIPDWVEPCYMAEDSFYKEDRNAVFVFFNSRGTNNYILAYSDPSKHLVKRRIVWHRRR